MLADGNAGIRRSRLARAGEIRRGNCGGKFGHVDSCLSFGAAKRFTTVHTKTDYDKIYGKEANESGPLNPLNHGGPYNYFNPWWHPFYRRGDLHTMQSVTKTVTSVVIGVASACHAFPALDTPILKYFDETKWRTWMDANGALRFDIC